MHQSVKNIIDLNDNVKQNIKELKYEDYNPKIIAVSKTFKMEDIMPLIEYGHQDFGENKVQEAFSKWKEVKANKNHVKLDTLSMGTTIDMNAAIAEGATFVRIGTAIFGPRIQ